MAPKKQNHPPPKPEEEVSEEEEEEEDQEEEEGEEQKQPEKSQLSSEEEEEESDEEEEVQTPINHQIQSSSQDVQKPSDEEQSESEGEEDDDDDENEEPGLTNTESEYPPSPTASDFTVRPITSTPKGSKPTLKRPLDFAKDDGKHSGIKKKVNTGEEDAKKGKSAASSGRIWSEEKEIAMLRGIIDYQKKKGPLRSTDMGAFHDFIKGKLWDGVSKNQVGDKVKRFKGKYFAKVKKGENGEDPRLKPHEKKVFDLCGQIWGGVNESNGIVNKAKVTSENGKAKKGGNGSKESSIKTEDDIKVKNSVKRKKGSVSGSESINVDEDGKNKRKKGSVSGSDLMIVDEDGKENLSKDHLKKDEEKDFLTNFPYLSNSLDAKMGSFKDNIYLIGSKKAKELDERWKKVRIEEMDLMAEELRLQAEQTKLVLDAIKESRGDC